MSVRELTEDDLSLSAARLAAQARARLPTSSARELRERAETLVCTHFRVPLAFVRERSRLKRRALLRHVAIYLAREAAPPGALRASYPELARAFGGLDHTSVMYAVRRVELLIARDAQLRATVSALLACMQPGAPAPGGA